MYDLNDTIVAVSSPPSGARAIVRITGPDAIDKVSQIFSPPIPKERSGLIPGSVAVDAELRINAKLYLFLAPRSYTGDDVVEVHIDTNPAVTKALIGRFLNEGLRAAGPGEFTARAYLNGKIDLAQAEAVNEIITCSNKFQLAAAEKLLSGRLAETTEKIRSALMDCLSLIEAGLDFSGEDIEFITRPQAVERLVEIKDQLQQLLPGSLSDEAVIDLPAVGIAGAPNAGKSTLLNKLLGKARSITSEQRKTTRDILTGLLTLAHCSCVLFDCAGLTPAPSNILDELAQQAAIEALQKASVVIFCVDVSKDTPADWAEEASIRKLIEPKALTAVATKSDSLSERALAKRLAELNRLFAADFIPVSAKTASHLKLLQQTIDKKIVELMAGPAGAESAALPFSESRQSGSELTARHRQAVTEAIENIDESIGELKAGSDEVAAMMLRAAYQCVCDIEQQHVDEQILERIFQRFCIGK